MRFARLLVFVFLLRLAIPLLAFLMTGTTGAFVANTDAHEYLSLARSILDDGAFYARGLPEVHRPPGYPLILAAGIAAGNVYVVALLLQALAACATVAFVAAIIRDQTRDTTAAWIGAAACACEPLQMMWGASLMPETFLAACVAFLAWGFLRDLAMPSTASLAATVTGTVLAAYMKPVAMFLPLWLAAMWLLIGHRRHALRTAVMRAVLIVLLCAAGFAPWMIRNAITANYIGFSSELDRALAFRIPALLAAQREQSSYADVRQAIRRTESTENVVSLRRHGLRALAEAPWTVGRLYVTGMARTVFNPGALHLLTLMGYDVRPMTKTVFDQGVVAGVVAARRDLVVLITTIILGVLLGIYFVFAARAMLASSLDLTLRLALASIILYFLLLSGGPWGQSRFRLPMMPLVVALCGITVADLRARADGP